MMKDKAIKYLVKNPLLHMGMIEPIRRNTVNILYADKDGVLLKEQKSEAYMLSVDNFGKCAELINGISECNLIALHQEFMVDYIASKYALNEKIECFQAVYMGKVKMHVKEELEIRQLEQKHLDIILEHYDKLSDSEIKELLSIGNLFGGYKSGELIGFVGNHLEGSIGLLEIFPKYRRLGYGTILESFIVNQMIEKDLVPFGQIEVNNERSKAMHKKLGFKISENRLYWLC